MVYHKTKKIIKKQQERKKKILTVAREILAKEETGIISIKTIAKKAGIATGTFYLYFKDKEALIDTIIKEFYDELLEIIKRERAQYTNGFDKLVASMEACIKTFMEKKHLAKILLDLSPPSNAIINNKFTDIENDLIRLTKIDLDELMEQQLIPIQDTRVSATAFVGAFREVILSWINGDEPADMDMACKTLINFNMRGLGKN